MGKGSHEAQGLLWGAEPQGWASHESNHSPLFRAMMDAAGVRSGVNVLDVGCGAGHSCALIEATGATVVGVDAARGMVDYANKAFDGIDFQAVANPGCRSWPVLFSVFGEIVEELQ